MGPQEPGQSVAKQQGIEEAAAAAAGADLVRDGAVEGVPRAGHGGRSAMVGPVYYDDATLKSDVKLPVGRYDRTLFVYDWMRNWIKAVKLDEKYQIARIEPFLPKMSFRKPIDIRTDPEGALYVCEDGAKWGDHHRPSSR